ncbi:MAG: acetyl-CoA carboxylase carboxyltransferase subunit alpha [Blastocatellia bacterium]
MQTESHLNLVQPAEPQAMDRVQLARHDRRPYALDYIERIFTDFRELHGDRSFRDDPAIVGGTACLDGRPVMVIAQQKGRHLRERQLRNFGMPKPDGYRKALRLMQLADKFSRPIITLVDTPGAFPGIDAEERGQAQAIAFNLREMARLRVPVIVIITGEGGSGGALAIAVGDRVIMMENSIYSVITPEGCAAILWKDAKEAPRAAASMKVTAPNLQDLGLIDRVIAEPQNGAQEDWDAASALLKETILSSLQEVEIQSVEVRMKARYQKFRAMGQVLER